MVQHSRMTGLGDIEEEGGGIVLDVTLPTLIITTTSSLYDTYLRLKIQWVSLCICMHACFGLLRGADD